jgi:hypothetical protein
MGIKEFTEPRSHIVIDDFFPPEMLQSVWKDILHLKDSMKIGLKGASLNLFDEIKKNQLVVVNDDFRLNNNTIDLLKTVRARVWSPYVRERLRVARSPIFQLLEFCDGPFVQVSAYGDGDHYGEHVDDNPIPNLTVVGFLCKEPKPFTGGDFILKLGDEETLIEFKNNRFIIFPSNTLHKVTPVSLKDDKYENFRFSLQVWPKPQPNYYYKYQNHGASDMGQLLTSFTTVSNAPTFAVDPSILERLPPLLETVEFKADTEKSFLPSVSAFLDTVNILLSNLKYLARADFKAKDTIQNSRINKSGEIEVTCEFQRAEMVWKLGYRLVIAEKGEGRLKIFVQLNEKSAKPNAERPVSFAENHAGTLKVVQSLVQETLTSGGTPERIENPLRGSA